MTALYGASCYIKLDLNSLQRSVWNAEQKSFHSCFDCIFKMRHHWYHTNVEALGRFVSAIPRSPTCRFTHCTHRCYCSFSHVFLSIFVQHQKQLHASLDIPLFLISWWQWVSQTGRNVKLVLGKHKSITFYMIWNVYNILYFFRFDIMWHILHFVLFFHYEISKSNETMHNNLKKNVNFASLPLHLIVLTTQHDFRQVCMIQTPNIWLIKYGIYGLWMGNRYKFQHSLQGSSLETTIKRNILWSEQMRQGKYAISKTLKWHPTARLGWGMWTEQTVRSAPHRRPKIMTHDTAGVCPFNLLIVWRLKQN